MRVKHARPIHDRLWTLLHAEWVRGHVKQESLGRAIGRSQESAGYYLRNQSAAALSLDEASDALAHVGSSLTDFLAGLPPRDLDDTERLARRLANKPELLPLVEDLLDVPRPQHAAVLRLVRDVVLPAIVRPKAKNGGFQNGPTPGPRTTKGSRKRR